MSELTADITTTKNGFTVVGNEEINYGFSYIYCHDCPFTHSTMIDFIGFQFVDNIFDSKHDHLAKIYKPWKRVLLVTDTNVNELYSKQWSAYFAHHGIPLTTFIMNGGEKNKTMNTMLSIVDAMNAFGLIRKEVCCFILLVPLYRTHLNPCSLFSWSVEVFVPMSLATPAPPTGAPRTSSAFPPP